MSKQVSFLFFLIVGALLFLVAAMPGAASAEKWEDEDPDWELCEGTVADYVYIGNEQFPWEEASMELEAEPFEIYRFDGERDESCNAFTVFDRNEKIILSVPFPENPDEPVYLICPKKTAKINVTLGRHVDLDDLGFDATEDEEVLPAVLKRKANRATLSIVGDSISTFKGYLPTFNRAFYNGYNCDVSSAAQMWWAVVAREMGYRISTIDAWSASEVTTVAGAFPAMCMSRTSRLDELGTPDIIIIFGGMNDYLDACPLGTWTGKDPLPSSGGTFRDAYAIMLDKIHRNYPMAKIYCCTIINCERDGILYNIENISGQYLHEFNEAIREIALVFNCEVIELNSCGINPYNMEELMGDYNPEDGGGLHPNAKGQKLIAEKIIQALK